MDDELEVKKRECTVLWIVVAILLFTIYAII